MEEIGYQVGFSVDNSDKLDKLNLYYERLIIKFYVKNYFKSNETFYYIKQ